MLQVQSVRTGCLWPDTPSNFNVRARTTETAKPAGLRPARGGASTDRASSLCPLHGTTWQLHGRVFACPSHDVHRSPLLPTSVCESTAGNGRSSQFEQAPSPLSRLIGIGPPLVVPPLVVPTRVVVPPPSFCW
mmetsp:Transcript_55474/g.152570  ORF Transcript_55474/g.152570 Transcript_55474/m.152570 type:complete len:133 (+) Transcript_55474:166-564(+)